MFTSPRRLVFTLLALVLTLAVSTPAALAQATKIFVASYGKDTNVGNSVSPMRTFQSAHDAVAAGGEIVVLDTAGYGALTITKSVSLVVPPGVNGFVTVSGDAGGITIGAGATDVVSLRGLIIEGGGADTDPNTSNGIYAYSVGTLRVEDCNIRNFNTGVALSCATVAHLLVSGGSVRDIQYGIALAASANSANADGIVTGCVVSSASQTALYSAPDDGVTATCTLVASGCVLTGSYVGLFTFSGLIYADACTLSNNTFDLNNDSGGTGQIISRGNNTLTGNANHQPFDAALAAQ